MSEELEDQPNKRGAQLGNDNKRKGRIWRAAIHAEAGKRARRKGLTLEEAYQGIAAKLLDMCEAGDIAAIREFGDRIEGKSVQAVDAHVEGGLTVNIVRFCEIDGASNAPGS